jgi:protein-S-isoprenylcysteine O-methyltransferase Ste14
MRRMVKPVLISPALRHRAGQVLVALQFALLAGLVWRGAAAVGWWWSGSVPSRLAVLLVLVSVILGLWTLFYNRLGNFNIHPQPRTHGQLVVGGPYRWMRHPMYTSVLLLAGALALKQPDGTALAAWLALLAVLWAKSRIEEDWLCEHHPGYAAYCQGCKRFVPGVWYSPSSACVRCYLIESAKRQQFTGWQTLQN